jgi:hypothetical protein
VQVFPRKVGSGKCRGFPRASGEKCRHSPGKRGGGEKTSIQEGVRP